MIVFNKKKKERLNFFVQTQGTVRQGKRETHAPGREFWFPTFQAGKADGTGTVPCGRPFPYFFFPFFLFFCVVGRIAGKQGQFSVDPLC